MLDHWLLTVSSAEFRDCSEVSPEGPGTSEVKPALMGSGTSEVSPERSQTLRPVLGGRSQSWEVRDRWGQSW